MTLAEACKKSPHNLAILRIDERTYVAVADGSFLWRQYATTRRRVLVGQDFPVCCSVQWEPLTDEDVARRKPHISLQRDERSSDD